MGKEEDLRRMFQELTGYEKKKIDLKMEGIPASPMQIVQAHQMREGVTYMRDYILDDELILHGLYGRLQVFCLQHCLVW